MPREGSKSQISDIDAIVDAAAIEGEISTGVSPSFVAARSSMGKRGVIALAGKREKTRRQGKMPKWSIEEDDFLERNLGFLSDAEIGEQLGRTEGAVHLRWSRDLKLPAPSKNPWVMTGNQIAAGLGIDSHAVLNLIRRGLLPSRRLPGKDVTHVVDRKSLLRWVVNPDHWVYFKPERVGLCPPQRRGGKVYDRAFWRYARRLVLKKKRLWKDRWVRIGEIARYHQVSQQAVNKAFRAGRFHGIAWPNWWGKASECMNPKRPFQVREGKGGKGHEHIVLSPSAAAMLILARAVGLSYKEIGSMMGWKEKRVEFLFARLRRKGQIPGIVKRNKLAVFYDRSSGQVLADWRTHKKRFPHLARSMKTWEEKATLSRAESKYFNNVRAKAARFQQAEKKRKASPAKAAHPQKRRRA